MIFKKQDQLYNWLICRIAWDDGRLFSQSDYLSTLEEKKGVTNSATTDYLSTL